MLVLLLSDSLKSSMGSSLGSVPSDMGQKKKKGKQHSKSLTCCFDANDIEEVEQSIDA